MNWRLEQTSGHGHLVDWGIHLIDGCRKILDLPMPRAITAAGGIYQLKDKITTPDTLTAHFEFERLPIVWRHRTLGRRRVPARNQQRHLLLRREGDDLRHRFELDGDTAGEVEGAEGVQGRFRPWVRRT